MLGEFFQLGPIPDDELLGTYSSHLVILSYLVAVFASYIALDFTGRLRDVSNTQVSGLLWLLGGAVAMGAGIWSMHFIGMLSFTMPMMTMHYGSFWTIISLIIAMIASGFALFLLKDKSLSITHLATGGVLLGIGIASMHYTGMEAMKVQMNLHYLPGVFLLSIIIAIVASEAALWLALKSNQVVRRMQVRLKFVSALIMGAAICGMHYTGMAATVFTPRADGMHVMNTMNPDIMAMSITAVTLIILSIAFFASAYKEAINEDQIALARQLGMAEVAASVLHNVGNVLNSVSVSAKLMADKVTHSKINSIKDLSALMLEHKDNIAKFMTEDPRGIKIPEFLQRISQYWHSESEVLANEASTLITNIQRINEIISIQQGLSKNLEVENLVSIEEILDESILITGLKNNSDFKLEKKYANLRPILVDKIKLSQILINILSNAKDALKESPDPNKQITIEYYLEKNKEFVMIAITDNGIGIAPENIKNIFVYGFTTKSNGHGFGLHTSALALNHMGGTISAVSDKEKKLTTFTLQLPYKVPK